jgi:hypothetical protein
MWVDVSEAREIGASEKAVRLAFGSSMSGGYIKKIWVPRKALRLGEYRDNGLLYMAGWFYFKHALWKAPE